MPHHYSLENLPTPNNKKIGFVKVPSHKAAVIRFSGFVNENTLKKKTDELQNWIKDQEMGIKGNFISARYDPPWIPWFLRRNEIMVSVF
jgi:effector-binding domain-containing protein